MLKSVKKSVLLALIFTLLMSARVLISCGRKISVVVPASTFEGTGRNEIIENAAGEGIEAVRNIDGSYTFTMSDKTHQRVIKNQMEIIDSGYAEYVTLTELYPALKELTHNEDMTVITMQLDRELFEKDGGAERFLVYALYLEAEFVQIISGASFDDIKVEFILVDCETGDILETVLYSDYINQTSDVYDETGW